MEGRQHTHEGHDHTHNHDHDHNHDHGDEAGWKGHWDLLLSFAILSTLLTLEFGFNIEVTNPFAFIVNAIAWLLAGWRVVGMAIRKARRLDIFNEFVLMTVATIGAFYIGDYTEGVAVMVFYSIGEWFQDSAIQRAKASIKQLLDIRPDKVTVVRNNAEQVVKPAEVKAGEIIRIRPGEKAALDGELLSEKASLNTAALTGESRPNTKYKGEPILAGMINLSTVSEVKVTAAFTDSRLSKILAMVRHASARKSQTQLFISRFAKVYTPMVFFLAIAVVFGPYIFVADYNFDQWLYRGLVFLVISCPCALVVSIPLGYFGGIGLASRNGILFKGGNFLDVMTKVDTIIMDKTGTLTKGVFKVQQVQTDNFDQEELIRLAAALERNSTHPIAKAIAEYAGDKAKDLQATDVEEVAGHGLRGKVNGKQVQVGNIKLFKRSGITYPPQIELEADTIVAVAVDNRYAGYIIIADEIKEDALGAIREMHGLGLKTVMLSGDKESVVAKVAKQLDIGDSYGDLLPEGKVEKVTQLKNRGRRIAFVGDGFNDAPVIALADAGIAMGGLGSDATIETADVVIQNDQPSKIVAAIRAGRITRNIVWENIIAAMVVKAVVLILGAGGMANLWQAVIADVGVALLAILNAVRIQRMKL